MAWNSLFSLALPTDAPAKYGTVAALVVVVYDYVLTFDDEVDFVWRRGWSFGKALFFLNRYFGLFTLLFDTTLMFLDTLSYQFCQNLHWWELISEVIAIISAEIILIIRIHAVYERNRALLLLLLALLSGVVISSMLLAVLGMPASTVMRVTGLTGCQTTARPPHFFLCWIAPLLFETILMSLMLYKGWRIYKREAGSKLLHLIVVDSFLYFLVMFMALLANCISWALPVKLGLTLDLAMRWSVAVPCVMGSRLLLNMRKRFFTEETQVVSMGYPRLGISYRDNQSRQVHISDIRLS